MLRARAIIVIPMTVIVNNKHCQYLNRLTCTACVMNRGGQHVNSRIKARAVASGQSGIQTHKEAQNLAQSSGLNVWFRKAISTVMRAWVCKKTFNTKHHPVNLQNTYNKRSTEQIYIHIYIIYIIWVLGKTKNKSKGELSQVPGSNVTTESINPHFIIYTNPNGYLLSYDAVIWEPSGPIDY